MNDTIKELKELALFWFGILAYGAIILLGLLLGAWLIYGFFIALP